MMYFSTEIKKSKDRVETYENKLERIANSIAVYLIKQKLLVDQNLKFDSEVSLYLKSFCPGIRETLRNSFLMFLQQMTKEIKPENRNQDILLISFVIPKSLSGKSSGVALSPFLNTPREFFSKNFDEPYFFENMIHYIYLEKNKNQALSKLMLIGTKGTSFRFCYCEFNSKNVKKEKAENNFTESEDFTKKEYFLVVTNSFLVPFSTLFNGLPKKTEGLPKKTSLTEEKPILTEGLPKKSNWIKNLLIGTGLGLVIIIIFFLIYKIYKS